MTARTTALCALVLGLATSCSGCPGAKWEGTEALVAQLECGMTPSEARQLVNRHSGLRWIETGVEPWDHAYHKGNTSVALNFEGSGLVAYEVSWESRFMFTEVMNVVNLCAGRPPAQSHPS